MRGQTCGAPVGIGDDEAIVTALGDVQVGKLQHLAGLPRQIGSVELPLVMKGTLPRSHRVKEDLPTRNRFAVDPTVENERSADSNQGGRPIQEDGVGKCRYQI